jgi:hypothetical protein
MLQRRLVRKTDDGRYVLTSRDGTGATAFADEDTGEGGSAERADSEDSPGVIASIVEFLREATEATPLSKAGILAKLTERFPDRPPEAMKKTIGCQVPSRLRSEKGLAVRQNAGGFWIIADEGAGLRSGPTLPPEPFQEAAGEAQQVAGDDETFREWLVRTLREQDRNVAAGVAERLFAWADANGYQECGNRTPSPGGSLRFALRHSGQQFEVFSFGGKGELQLPLQYMMTGPFKEERLRREYLDRIGRIPGVYERRERWDRLTGWPSFPLEALAEPANFDQFLQAVDWAAEEIRTGQV